MQEAGDAAALPLREEVLEQSEALQTGDVSAGRDKGGIGRWSDVSRLRQRCGLVAAVERHSEAWPGRLGR